MSDASNRGNSPSMDALGDDQSADRDKADYYRGVLMTEKEANTYRNIDLRLSRARERQTEASMRQATEFAGETNRVFRTTLGRAAGTYKTLTWMSVGMFLVGIGLFVFSALWAVFAETKDYAYFFAGLGATTFVAIFVLKPFVLAEQALSDLVQVEVGFMSFFEQIRMWSSYPWVGGEGTLDDARAREASDMLMKRSRESMALLEKYLEPPNREGKPWWASKKGDDSRGEASNWENEAAVLPETSAQTETKTPQTAKTKKAQQKPKTAKIPAATR